MHPFDFIESINGRVTEYVAKMQEVLPEDLGLDRRAGYRFYVDKDMTTIVTPKYRDNSLQYRDWETDRKSTRLNSSHRL